MKQKFLLLMLLLLSCWGGTRATELTVYDGTATSGYVPVYGYYADNFLKCEFVIPATELTVMKGGSLKGMTFYLSSKASAAWTGTFQVFLKEVDFTTISAYQGTSDATIVYDGALDATKATMKIDFSTSYTYGGGNLLVGVYHTPKGDYTSASFYGTTVTGACVQGYGSSMNNVSVNQRDFIPKTTFEYEAAGTVYKTPNNVTQSNLTYSGVTYSWTAPEGATATGYAYQYKMASETEWSALTSTTGTFVNLSDLTPKTAYQFRVCANYSGGNSSDWVTRSFTTLEKWKNPTNLLSPEVTHNSAKLSWTENGGATSWVVAYREAAYDEEGNEIHYYLDDDDEYHEIPFSAKDANENPFTLTGLEENTKYYVKVRPKSDDETIKWSSTTTFNTKEQYPKPSSLSVKNIGMETATLSWNIDSYNNSIRDGYVVRYKPTSGTGWTTVSVDKANTTYQLTGLQGGTEYQVEVCAKYGAVSSDYSTSKTFTTIAYNTAPTSLYTNDITYTGATQKWTGYQESYNVRWRTVSGIFHDGFENGLRWETRDCYFNSRIMNSVWGTLGCHSGSVFFNFDGDDTKPNQTLISPALTGISEGASLTFWYKPQTSGLKFKVGYSTTTNETNKFTWSDEQTANTTTTYTKYEQTLPADVKYIAICYTSTSWDFGVDDISIVDPANAYGKWQTANGVTSPYSLSDLTQNTTYEWQVQGIDTEHLSSGVTDWSDLTEFTTKNKWQTPTSLSLSSKTHNSATLRWTENGLATSWIVAYKKSSDTDFTEVEASQNPFTLTDLEENTKYTVKVRPNSDDDNEWWSDYMQFTTNNFWTAPTLNSVSDYTHNSATLRWTENGGATSWVVAYKKSSDTDFTEVEASQNPFTLTGLDEQTQYTVKVSPKTDDDTYKWSYTQTFTTKEQFPKPNYISAGNIGTEWATVRWSMPSSGSVIVIPVSGSTTTVVAATPAPSGDGSSKEAVVVGPSYGEASTPDGYVLSYRVKAGEGETEKEWTVIEGITKTSYELTDLTGGTQYEVCVQAKYGENLSGYYPSTTPYSFTTLSYCTVPSNLMATDIMRDAASLSWTGYQDSYDVQWREAPILFMDGFEDGLGNWTLRDCYSSQFGKTGISTSSRYNHTGKQSFYFCGDPNHVLMDQKLISPELNDIPEGAKLSFWYCGSGQFYVGYSTATNSSEDFTWERGPYENTEMIFEVNWGKYEFTLPADVKYIGISFHYYGDCYIDDILITGHESAFGEWQMAENQGNPCSITDLKADTYYEWQVMGKSEHCSGTDWSESSYFTTLSAQTKFFVKDGNWNVDDNWDPVGVPEPTEDVYIAAKATIPDGYVADVQNLTVFESGSITLKDGGQLKTLSSNVPVSFEKDITGYGEGDGTNHFIASPVNTLVKDIENLKTGDYDFYFFANFNPLEWLNMKNLAAYYPPEWDPDETFSIGPGAKEGYLYANKEDKTLTFSGSTGVPSKEYFCQSSIYSAPSSRFDGWYLVGNPYTCDAYVTLEPIMSSGSYIFVPATPADPSVVDFGEYGAPLGDIYVDLDDPGSPVVIDNPTAGGPFVTFYKMNATGDALKMYYDQVKLAPGEGVLVHAVIPPASGSGNVNYGITFFTENVFGDALSYEPEGDILIPILPRHGLAIDQDANGIMVMNNEKNSDILKKYDKSKVGDELLDVTLQGRTLFTDGRWNTLCLPFDLTAEQLTNSQLAGFQIKELDTEAGTYDHITGYEADTKTLWLNFKDVTEIEAGKPYIAKNTIFPLEGSGIELKDIENPKFTNVQIDSSDPEGIESKDETTTFQGVYDPVVITEKDRSVLFLQGEKLYYPDGVKPTTIGACRAYFPLNGIYGGVPEETSGVHNFVLNFGDGETTGITTTKLTNQNVDWYSIDGRKLNQKPQQRGIYISNGRKVMVK